jgi:DNA-binding response OmpR family regulator
MKNSGTKDLSMLIVSPPVRADNSMSSLVSSDHTYDTVPGTSRVLLLANDMLGVQGMHEPLAHADCRVTPTNSVDKALELLQDDDFDVVVVDFRPDLLGYQAVCQLRTAGVDLPILFVSARSSAAAHARAQDVGADDVVVMPMKGRIQALSGPAGLTRTPHFPRIGSLQLDLTERRVRVGGEALALTSTEYAVLELLMSRDGSPTAKHQIEACAAAAGDQEPKRHMDALIARLRGKLDAAGASGAICVVRGFGYALNHASARSGGLQTAEARA